jgi:hypothetical protein
LTRTTDDEDAMPEATRTPEDAATGTSRPRIRALLVGQAHWVRQLTEGLGCYAGIDVTAVPIDGIGDAARLLEPGLGRDADVLVRVGFRPGAHTPRGRALDAALARVERRMKRPAIVYYWLGTDVRNTVAERERGLPMERFERAAQAATHVADSEALQRELADLGVTSTVAWLPAPNAPRERVAVPFPEAFTVLSYVPDNRPAFFDGPTVLDVARRLREARFRILGGKGTWVAAGERPDNVEFLGWRSDMAELYTGSSVLVRLLENDSVSCMVIEAMAYGRPVIYSEPFPHAEHVAFGDAEGLERALRRMLEAYRPGSAEIDEEAAAWARGLADEESCFATIGAAFRSAIDER